MFDLTGAKSKKKNNNQEEDVKQVLEVLTTSVEAINQRLAGTNMDDSFNQTMKEFLPKVNSGLKQLVQQTTQVQKTIGDMNNRVYKMEQNVSASIKGFEEELGKQRRTLDEAIENINSTQKLTTKVVTESNEKFSQKLQQMIEIHMSEIELLRNQNKTFIKHMQKLEESLEVIDVRNES